MWGRRFQLTMFWYAAIVAALMLSSSYQCEGQTIEVVSEDANNPDTDNSDTVKGKIQGKVTPIETYMRLFEQKRAMQLDAVKSIQKFSKYEQRYKLIDTMAKQLFEVIEGCKQNLTDWGFIPGDPFPENETIRDSVAKVLESTAMFGDLILRQPDVTHAIYARHKEWEFLIGWAVWFSMESGVFTGKHQTLLNLMGQELGLMPKDENYVNPYRESAMEEDEESSSQSDDKKKAKKKSNKKKTKEKRKGPKLGGTQHTEL